MASRNRRNRRLAERSGARSALTSPLGPTQAPVRATSDYKVKPVVTAPLPSLLSGGKAATADARLDYLAGGGGVFPLAGQTILAKPGDDLSRDLGQQIYETMLYDPTVWSGLVILWTGILAGELQLVPAFKEKPGEAADPTSEQGQDIERAKYWADFCQHNLDNLDRPFKQILWDIGTLAFTYGVKIAEKICDEGDGDYEGRLTLKALKVKPQTSWNFVVDPYGDVVAIRGLIYGGGLADLPPEKFLIFTWQSRDRDPRGRSGLRSAYNGWNLKVNTWPKFFTYLDLFACPTPVGITAEDATKEPAVDASGNPTGQQWTPTQALGWALSNIGPGKSIAVRYGTDIKWIQAQGNGEAFHNAFDRYDREILKAILTSPRASMEAEHGSKADSQVGRDNVEGVIAYGREMLGTAIRDQLCHWLIELNAGKAEADRYCPEVSLGKVTHNDLGKVGQSLAALGYQVDQTQWPSIDADNGLPVRNIQDLAQQALQQEGAATVASAPGGVAPGAQGHEDNPPTSSAQEAEGGLLNPAPKGFPGLKRNGQPKPAPLPRSPSRRDLASVGVAGSTAAFRTAPEGEDDQDPFELIMMRGTWRS